jgi:hypothetical protein
MTGMGEVDLGSRAEWGLRCWTGVWTPGTPGRLWSVLGATFAGEFSNVTRSYAGKGLVRHVW